MSFIVVCFWEGHSGLKDKTIGVLECDLRKFLELVGHPRLGFDELLLAIIACVESYIGICI